MQGLLDTPVRTTSKGSGVPILVYDDEADQAESLCEELRKKGRTAEVFVTRPELLARAGDLHRADFAIDIDFGRENQKEGLIAIRELTKMATDRDFLIMALTSHPEFETVASQAGASAFLLKTSVKTDALELLTRSVAHDTSNMARAGGQLEQELASREYGRLRDTWLQARERAYDPQLLDDIEQGIARALRWPFASTRELAVLVSLRRLIQRVGEIHDGSAPLAELVTMGFELLNGLQELTYGAIDEWLCRLDVIGEETHLRWLEDEDHD